MSSLSTLLEAAKFLEMQEQEQQHNHSTTVAVAETLATMKPVASTIITKHIPNHHIHQNGIPTIALTSHTTLKTVTASSAPQTVVISSNNLSNAILKGPITFSTAPPQLHLKKEQDEQVSSTTVPQINRQRILHNSFDIRNAIGSIDGSSDGKRKQPPLVFRAGTREVHNKLEKHRRAHLKECFDILKKQLPTSQDEKKPSNLSILHSALRYIQTLKRKERELEHEMERLAREKISAQQRLASLKKDLMSHCDNIDFSKILPEGNISLESNVSTAVKEDSLEEISTNGNCFQNGEIQEVSTLPILTKTNIPVVTQTITTLKEVPQPVQTTALSVLPMTYPVNQLNQGLVLQKVIVPKGLDHLTPLVSTHFITTPQQINGKVVPLTQYLVKPVVVVSNASPRPS